MKKSEMNSLFGCYKNTFEILDENKEQALTWIINFVNLFFLPFTWTFFWVYLTFKEDKDED